MKKDKSIFIKNVYYMLSYAFQTLHPNEYDDVEKEEFENILTANKISFIAIIRLYSIYFFFKNISDFFAHVGRMIKRRIVLFTGLFNKKRAMAPSEIAFYFTDSITMEEASRRSLAISLDALFSRPKIFWISANIFVPPYRPKIRFNRPKKPSSSSKDNNGTSSPIKRCTILR